VIRHYCQREVGENVCGKPPLVFLHGCDVWLQVDQFGYVIRHRASVLGVMVAKIPDHAS
jgi:hypothetical protein